MDEQDEPRLPADDGDRRRKAIFDSAVEFGIVATDTSGLITDWNAGAVEIFGWTADEMRGTPADRIFTPEDVVGGRVAYEMSVSLASGRSADERWHLRKDGSRFWASGEMMPLRDEHGRHLGFLKILRDRTAEHEEIEHRREADRQALDAQAAALSDSRDFTRLALSAIGGVGVWTFEVAEDKFYCDAAISRLYGLDPAEGERGLLRKDFLANVHPDDIPALGATMSGGLQRPGDLELEYRIRYPDGSVAWVLSRGHTYFDDAGTPVRRTGIGVDMTRQRVLEAQLRQSQKLEAVGQLTGGIAHDFNNMLSTINTSVELVRRKMATSPPAELERYLAMASKAIRSAATLTQRLLTFSRKQTLDIRAVNVNRQASDMADMLRRTLGENVVLRLELAPDLWFAKTDPHQLEQSLVNLAVNAQAAMPEGGSLTVTTANVQVEAGFNRDGEEIQAGDYVAIRVTDTGVGMPPEVIRRAFDPFFTTKPIGEGTGLGLSMIYGYAKQSGGLASIRSSPGAGTTVELLLPRTIEAESFVDLPASIAEAARGTGQRVLVVEDEPDVLAALLDVIGQHGYEVTSATEGSRALAMLSAGHFDALVTDIGLPGMSGRELALRARELRPELRVLFVTGYAGDAAVRADFLSRGMDLMSKPFNLVELLHKLHQLTAT